MAGDLALKVLMVSQIRAILGCSMSLLYVIEDHVARFGGMKNKIRKRAQGLSEGLYTLKRRRGLWFRVRGPKGGAQGVIPSRDTDCFGMGLLRQGVQSGICSSGSGLGEDSIPMHLPREMLGPTPLSPL